MSASMSVYSIKLFIVSRLISTVMARLLYQAVTTDFGEISYVFINN